MSGQTLTPTKKICSIEDCETKVIARGWCNKHYQRWRTHGDPLKTLLERDPEIRFKENTKWQGECLVWTGHTCERGYGQLKIGGKVVGPHVYAWERVHGPIPEGYFVDHKCHNPSCVNVKHLRKATNSQNQANLKGLSSRNTSGVRNVSFKNGKYEVSIRHEGKNHYFGRFTDLEAAKEVAERNHRKLFGEYSNV